MAPRLNYQQFTNGLPDNPTMAFENVLASHQALISVFGIGFSTNRVLCHLTTGTNNDTILI